ncbi:MAG: hypothetical protein JW827_06015 [Spirochaetes bacterium]|nr:hypothetical protein [Spirochaetota bacterium]
MRRITSILIILFVLCGISFAQQETAGKQTGTEFSGLFFPRDTSQQNLELKLIEDFENSDTWRALMPSDQGMARVKKVVGAPATDAYKSKYGSQQYCLGLKAWTYHRGFTWTEITPPTPIRVVGKLKGLSIWACGRNYRHRLEIWVKSYQGVEYPIDLGSLNFRGWKHMPARIPMYIPYYTKYVPQYKPMDITRIIIRHDPNEIVGVYYLYLDTIEAIVDTYTDTYDGDNMINERGVERWEEVTSYKEEKKTSGTGGSETSTK